MSGAIILGIIGLILGFAQWKVNSEDQWLANQQAQKFNKDEAEKSRQWQEEQYKKYESVAAQMQQRQQAGLNPYEGITSMSVGSGSTASTSANQISPLSLPDMSVFSQLAKDFTIAEGQGIENQYQKEIFEKRKEQFEEQVRSLNLSNEKQDFWNRMFNAAHFNSDGTVNADNNTFLHEAKQKKHAAEAAEFDAKVAEFRKDIEEQKKYSEKFKYWVKETLGIDLDILPNHLRHEVTLYTFDLFANGRKPSSQDDDVLNSLFAEIEQWYKEEKAIHSDNADGISTDVKDIEYALKFVMENGPAAAEALKSFFTTLGPEWSELATKFVNFKDNFRGWWYDNLVSDDNPAKN